MEESQQGDTRSSSSPIARRTRARKSWSTSNRNASSTRNRRLRSKHPSHLLNPSTPDSISGDLYEETCQEVDRFRDLLPLLEGEHKRFIALLSECQVLKVTYLKRKRFYEDGVAALKLSREDIRALDEQTCRTVLMAVKLLGPTMRTMLSAAQSGKQPFRSSRIHLKESYHSPNPSVEELMNDWDDHFYMEVNYMAQRYFTVLVDGLKHLKELVSKNKVQLGQLQSLKFFLEKSVNLMVLPRADIPRVDKKECRRLVKRTKLFVMGALIRKYDRGDTKQVWPAESLLAISELLQQLDINSEPDQDDSALKGGAESSDYQSPPQGGRSLGGDWHHHSYKELLVSRRMHSPMLDEAYNKNYEGVLCDMLARTSNKFVKKSLDFLATSRAEMVLVSKEKFYYRLLLIKLFVLVTEGPVSANQNSLQPQALGSPPNWRNWIYEEIRGFRKKYSSELDKEMYRARHPEWTQNPGLAKRHNANSSIHVEESLTFVGFGRADLAGMPMVECLDMFWRFVHKLKCSTKYDNALAYEKSIESAFSDSTSQIQPQSLPYWRDEVYEEIKSKRTKFLYEFDALCKDLHQTRELTTEEAECKELLDRAFRFFAMNRYEIALLSEKEYDESVVSVNQDLGTLMDFLLTRLRQSKCRRAGYPCDISRILIERKTAS